MNEMQRLLLDLWSYATGEPFGAWTEEDAENEGERCAELYRRVQEAMEKEE